MQRVVRSTLVGLLTIAGLAACGDKVTVPAPTTSTPGTVVHSVTVSPASVTLQLGGTATLAASVDADAGVTDRTVTWSSSDATVATVDATGKVTASATKAGTVTIIASSTANPAVKGAAAVTVQAAAGTGGPVTVTISSINATNANGQSVPANLGAANGQLDVILNVDAAGQILKSVTTTLKCGTDSMTQTQTIGANAAPLAAEASSAPITMSFNTAAFNPSTGVPSLHNGSCTVSATATTAAGTQSASSGVALTLANADGVVLTTSNTGSTAIDAAGLPWKSGAITVSALPVLYSGRVPSSASITLPGANVAATQVVTAAASGATSATWSNTSTVAANVTQLTDVGAPDANGFRVGVHPTVVIVDSNGNDLALTQLNSTTQSDVRIDNQSPVAPTTSNLSAAVLANNNWITAGYTFTGTGKYVSGGDNAGVGGTTFTVFVAPVASAPAALTLTGGILTDVGAKCVTTGMTQVASGADVANSTNNAAYVVRVLETDKLGNVRCTDLNTAGVRTTFGVDKNPPLASITAGPANNTSATAVGLLGGGGNFTVAFSDSSSGFSATPFQVVITRLDATGTVCVNATTGATSAVPGGGCAANTIAAGPVSATGTNATNGYYTSDIKVFDQAGNSVDLGARTVLVDNAAPVPAGGVAIPANITANSAQSFSSGFTDNLDLISGEGSVAYPNMTLFYAGSMSPAGVTFDNVLNTTGTSTVTIPAFIIDMQQVDGGNAPTAAGAKPTNVNIRAIDGVGNFGTNAAALPAANIAGAVATEFAVANFATFQVSNAAANVKNSGSAANAGTPTTVTLTATITGAVSTANNPFSQVCFYYQNTAAGASSNGEWLLINCQGAASVTDAGGVRTWTYTAPAAFDPPSSLGTAGTLQIRAIGMNASGNAISTNTNANLTLVP